MRNLLVSAVIAMSLTVTGMAVADEPAAPAYAPDKPAAPVVAKEPELPLALRPSTPLALAEGPAPTPWIYKVAFGAALLAAGAIMWKRRRTLGGKRNAATAIRVLGKTAMGLRGELALVEVGGMRLVVGITSGSMQTLAILPDDYVLEETAADGETSRAMELAAANTDNAGSDAPKPRIDLATRARSLFASIDLGPPDPLRLGGASAFSASRYAGEGAFDDTPDSAPAPRTRARDTRAATAQRDERPRRSDTRDAPLEGQARGIALALRNRR